MADSDGLRVLKVRITGHRPAGVAVRLPAKGFHNSGDLGRELAGRGSAVETEVERDLVVARPARVQRSPGGCDLGQPPFDRRVDVLVRVEERECARIELLADPAQTSLDGGQLSAGNDARGGKPASVSDAAGDVKGVELVVGVERRRETLQLGQEAALEPTAPELAAAGGCAGYDAPSPGAPAPRARPTLPCERGGARRLTSPSRLPRSRPCRRPWTCADVRTPIPHSLMNPAAAD